MRILNLDQPVTPLAKLLYLVESRTPARLAGVVAQMRRDVAVVEGRLLLGDKPAWLVARPSVTSAPMTQPAAAAVAAGAPQPIPVVAKKAREVTRLTILDGGREHAVEVEKDQLLLQAALASGVNLAFSCTLGGCGTCKVRLVSGDIEMEEPHCLTDDEIRDGLRLVCVGRATTSECVVRVEREPA